MKLNTRQILEAYVEWRLYNDKLRGAGPTSRNLEIFYLRTFKEMTLRELSQEFGIARERVRQINAKMIRDFRRFIKLNNMKI